METRTESRNWSELKSKLKRKFPRLSENDLQHQDGKEEEMLRMVEYKLRITKKEMQNILSTL